MAKRASVGFFGYAVLVAVAIVGWGVFDYISLPAYNFQSFQFWVFLAVLSGGVVWLAGGLVGIRRAHLVAPLVAVAVLLAAALGSAASWLAWPGNAEKYYAQMPAVERSAAQFAADFPDDPKNPAAETLILPRTDKELSTAIAQGKLGNYGARFRLDLDIFTAMAVKRDGRTALVRVSPLDYTSFTVALSSGSTGTAGYIEVDQETEQARLVNVEGGMKYTPEAVFSHNLDRHLRFKYRSFLFGPKSFEIDDAGKPYWVVPVIKNRVGLFGGPDVAGTVLLDPVTGSSQYYERGSEPSWVDRVVPASLAVSQANSRLSLKDGWFNLVFGEKRDVFQLSDSYTYEVTRSAAGTRTWLVSGVTSPSESDQTLAGFMMVDLKTKEARRYDLSGITEMRAAQIAQADERVRAQALVATWPIPVNLGGEPAYFLFLKNAVQRQRYVYVDLASGQKVAMGSTIEEAKDQFARRAGAQAAPTADSPTASGTVLRVQAAPQENSVLFLLSGESEILYSVGADLNNGARFLAAGDKVEVKYRETPSSPGRRYVLGLLNKSLGR